MIKEKYLLCSKTFITQIKLTVGQCEMEKKLVRQASTMSHWVPPNRVAAERDREPGGKRGFWERLQKGARGA